MQKIISVFQRNYETDRLIRDELVPGAQWVLAGEGIATRKYDGVCTMIGGERPLGIFYRRHEIKNGKPRPAGWIEAQAPDPATGDCPGWIPVGAGPEDHWFRAAFQHAASEMTLYPGTYEAIGPHFQKNPERVDHDTLIRHGATVLEDCPRTFGGIREYLAGQDIEGIVFHHPDGRSCKVKIKDYGLKRMPLSLAAYFAG